MLEDSRSFSRARLLQGVAIVATAAYGWRAVPTAVRAATMTVPVVDALSIRVVVDNSHEFLPGGNVGGVAIERANPDFGSARSTKLEGQFGFSLFLESKIAASTKRLLLDFALTDDALRNNLAVLGIFPGTLDALVLSHGHIDHFAGLEPFVRRNRSGMRPDLALFTGGEDNFCYQHLRLPDGRFADAGFVDRRPLEAANVRIVLAERPTIVADHAFTTGTIPRSSFEHVFPNTWVEIGTREGAGCAADHFTAAERQGKIEPNLHHDEHATCYHVRDKGLVVITSCGHAGLLNTVRRAQDVSGVTKVHAVVGGFHLFPAPPEYVARVVSDLRAVAPDAVIPMHCSGPGFVAAMRAQMPERLVLSSVGSRYTFGS
ncbi:MAG: MBL fold metallo-hydrolase [Vulcanimicrobiaceae bacterium]